MIPHSILGKKENTISRNLKCTFIRHRFFQISYLEIELNVVILFNSFSIYSFYYSPFWSGVSTSIEVGGWKKKVGGRDEARGQRPRGTRGSGGILPWEIFEIWGICGAFSSILAKKLRLLEHCWASHFYPRIIKIFWKTCKTCDASCWKYIDLYF